MLLLFTYSLYPSVKWHIFLSVASGKLLHANTETYLHQPGEVMSIISTIVFVTSNIVLEVGLVDSAA
jgi:hypothetical protein